MKTLHAIFDPHVRTSGARSYRLAYNAILTLGLAGAILDSSPSIAQKWDQVLSDIVLFAATFFFIEYILRIIAAADGTHFDGMSRWRLRWRWIFSPQGLVDIAATAPLALLVMNGLFDRSARLLAMLWAFKLFRYTPGSSILARVFRFAWEPLFSVFVAFVVILLMAATLIHLLESAAQPATYGSIPLALWWTIVTLTTTGYGDVTPVTPLGRMLAGGVMVCGIGVFALWAGILANAFAHEVKRREFLHTWDMITQVPMFRDLGTETIADISHVLHSRDFAPDASIFKRGERGECMYFIVSGAVNVQMLPKPVTLGPGQFFGELALITGEPRSASTMAMQSTQLLVLDIADFREIAARRPELAKAVNDEAARRLTANGPAT